MLLEGSCAGRSCMRPGYPARSHIDLADRITVIEKEEKEVMRIISEEKK